MSKCAYAKCGKTIDPQKRVDAKFCSASCGERSRRQNPEFRAEVREYNRNAKRKERGIIPTRPEPDNCECCKRKTQRLNADHDHVTGAFRGWLCTDCNIGIGRLGDNMRGIKRAEAYLAKA